MSYLFYLLWFEFGYQYFYFKDTANCQKKKKSFIIVYLVTSGYKKNIITPYIERMSNHSKLSYSEQFFIFWSHLHFQLETGFMFMYFTSIKNHRIKFSLIIIVMLYQIRNAYYLTFCNVNIIVFKAYNNFTFYSTWQRIYFSLTLFNAAVILIRLKFPNFR